MHAGWDFSHGLRVGSSLAWSTYSSNSSLSIKTTLLEEIDVCLMNGPLTFSLANIRKARWKGRSNDGWTDHCSHTRWAMWTINIIYVTTDKNIEKNRIIGVYIAGNCGGQRRTLYEIFFTVSGVLPVVVSSAWPFSTFQTLKNNQKRSIKMNYD